MAAKGKTGRSKMKVRADKSLAGRKVSELVWAAVLGVAGASEALAAVRTTEFKAASDLPFSEDDLRALTKSDVLVMGEATAAAMSAVLDELPPEVLGLVQEALGDLDAAPTARAPEAADAAPAAAVAAAEDFAISQTPIHVAAADLGGSISDVGGSLWSTTDPIILADASAATGAAATAGAEAGAPAAAAAPSFSPALLSLLGVGAIAAAAGGGGGGGGGDSLIQTVANISGKVIDGYVAGAKVFVDADGDGQLDANEVSTTTNAQGAFTLSGNFAAGSKIIVQSGGVNVGLGTGTGALTKINTDLAATIDASGQVVVSPLTTLLANTPTLTESALKTSLGIDQSVSLNTFDPVAALKAGGAQATVAETVFAKAQQVMTVLQTAVASGVELGQAVSAVATGLATSTAGNGMDAAVTNVVNQIASTSTAFSGATQKAALVKSIDAINDTIETAYSGLAEAIQTGSTTAIANALAPTAVAQTDFLDAVSKSAETGTATGVAQFGNATQLAAKISEAQSDIVNNVQTLDVQSIAALQSASVSLTNAQVEIVVNDQQDATLLNQVLQNLPASSIEGLNLDTSLSNLHDQILQTVASAGVSTTNLEVAVGQY